MAQDHRLSKVEILIQQEKFAEAEGFLADLLREDPNNSNYLALLGEVYLQQGVLDKARAMVDNAIGWAPDAPYLFYLKGRIALQQERLDEAEELVGRAIEMDANDADYYALLASIKLSRKKFSAALELADRALGVDAENVLALNTRSTALNKLNRSAESFATIQGALREDPNNAYTHANYGWGLLEKGDRKKALEHFKEALQHNPNMEFAQAGILEALKAANPAYRLFLMYSFWMSKLTAKYQWGVIIGFYLAFRGLNALARNNEALAPFIIPLLIVLGVVAFSTWIISPVSNLFLRFNKYGKLLLSNKEKESSNFVALSLGVFALGLVLYFATSDQRFLPLAAFGFAMMLPFGTMFAPAKNKYGLLFYTLGLTLIGGLAVLSTFLSGVVFNTFSMLFVFGFVAFQWVANFMLIREDNL